MIRIGSRYERSDVFYTIDSRSGSTRPTVMRSNPLPSRAITPTETVKWQHGLRLDRLSARVMGSPDRWWVLMDRNPNVLDPMSLTPGTSIRIS